MTNTAAPGFPIEGGCTCCYVRYRVERAPLIVHCCHCTWCQRETGSAFAVNAMLESDQVILISGEVEVVETPSASGKGQRIARCPLCRVALWSHYAGAGDATRFLRVGTLDEPALLPPDAHIFVSTKQPWVMLPEGAKAFDGYYRRSAHWSAASLERWQALQARTTNAPDRD